jgi:hypothetical protein
MAVELDDLILRYRAALAGPDPHRVTAARIFNVATADVTPAQRRAGKLANYWANYHETYSVCPEFLVQFSIPPFRPEFNIMGRLTLPATAFPLVLDDGTVIEHRP